MIEITKTVQLAYIDPGSGALLVQMCIAFFVGLSFTFRRVREKVAGLFTRKNKDKTPE